RLTWNKLADDLEVSDQFMAGASVISLMKKRINGVRSQLFLRTRDWFISYFGFNEEGYLPASIIEDCAMYIAEHSYTCRLEKREGGGKRPGRVQGHFVSIINDLFIPLIYSYWFQSKQSLGRRNADRFLESITPQFLCLCLTAAQNTIHQYESGFYQQDKGFGDMLGAARNIY